MKNIDWRFTPHRVVAYGLCPDEECWDRLRARVLRQTRQDLGEFPTVPGRMTPFKLEGRSAAVVTIAIGGDRMDELCEIAAHEAYHVAWQHFDTMGEVAAGEEPWAYLVGEITGYLVRDYLDSRMMEQGLVRRKS